MTDQPTQPDDERPDSDNPEPVADDEAQPNPYADFDGDQDEVDD